MSKKPIDILFDQTEWKPLPNISPNSDGTPYATHYGIVNLGEIELRVFQMNTGQRIILEQDLAKFFGFDNAADFRESLGAVGFDKQPIEVKI